MRALRRPAFLVTLCAAVAVGAATLSCASSRKPSAPTGTPTPTATSTASPTPTSTMDPATLTFLATCSCTPTPTVTHTETPACVAPACTAAPASPTAVATPSVVISEIFTNGSTHWIELWNRGSAAENLTGYSLCQFPDYWTLPAGFTLNVNARVVVHWAASGTNTATDLYTGAGPVPLVAASGEMGYYVCGSFGIASCIRDYVEWGTPGHTRSTVAIAAGIWVGGAAAPALSGGWSLNVDPATSGDQPCHWILCPATPGS